VTQVTSSPDVAVTGSTGVLGGLVARELTDAGLAQRLLVRTLSKAPHLDGAEVVPFSFTDRDAATAALSGIHTVLMVSAHESEDRVDEHRAFVDSVQAAGVERIVYTSFLGAAPHATFTLARDHYLTEEYIKASGVGYTFLRDCLYLDFTPDLVGDDGVIRGPAGLGRVAAVSRADIARVAAMVLQRPADHVGETYDLTGPEALSMADVAEIVSAAWGTSVTYYNETVEEAYASRAKWGAPDWQNDAWVSTYTAIAAGELGNVTEAVERITGRAPISLDAFLRQAPDRSR
jgi:NAD(P)H dehydrogenase (quinone)